MSETGFHSPKNLVITVNALGGATQGLETCTSSSPEYVKGKPRSPAWVGDFRKDDSCLSLDFELPRPGLWRLCIGFRNTSGIKRAPLWMDGRLLGEAQFAVKRNFTDCDCGLLQLEAGSHRFEIRKGWGGFRIDRIVLKEQKSLPRRPAFIPCDPQASPAVHRLMEQLSRLKGKKFIAGQHLNSPGGTELRVIKEQTGELPALLGLDLLSYTPGTASTEQSEHCTQEIAGNALSVETGLEWARQGGLVTFCWHWFSPLAGRDKSFYTSNTGFSLKQALVDGTAEHSALMRDLDLVADQLERFAREDLPVLWRPLHEAEGGWFWWGAEGPKAYLDLYSLMFTHFTRVRGLHNLIWVWNAPHPEWYPGDSMVDIATSDHYSPAHVHDPLSLACNYLQKLVKGKKPVAMGENGPIPDPGLCQAFGSPWLWWMTWWGMAQEETHTSFERLRAIYRNPATLTLKAWQDFSRK